VEKTEALLLNLIQREFPAVPRPYAKLARRLAAGGGQPGPAPATLHDAPATPAGAPTGPEVHAAVNRLRDQGFIRRLGGVFDSRALGFHTTLVAAAVPPERLDEVAAVVNGYPEVTHNYSREAPLNLWFTLVASSPERAADVLRALELGTGIEFHDFPAERVFKREVRFRFAEGLGAVGAAAGGDHGRGEPHRGDAHRGGSHGGDSHRGSSHHGEQAAGPRGRPPRPSPDPAQPLRPSPDPTDRRIIAALQGDLPRGREPYAEIAADLSLSPDELLRRVELFRRRGWLRRIAAVVAHRKAGVEGNAMVVWEIPEERIEEAGRALAGFEAVTHCYARAPAKGWPYRLYSMVHAPTREEALDTVGRIARAAGLGRHKVLFSVREFKKTSPRYY